MNSTLRSGRRSPGGVGELAAVQARQAHVGDQQVDAPPDCRIFSPSGPSAASSVAVAEVLQHLDDQAAHRRLVLDDQHRLAGSARGASASVDGLVSASVSPRWRGR